MTMLRMGGWNEPMSNPNLMGGGRGIFGGSLREAMLGRTALPYQSDAGGISVPRVIKEASVEQIMGGRRASYTGIHEHN
jgi:hypothetical protein